MTLPSTAVTTIVYSAVLPLLVSIDNIADAFTVPSSLGRHVGIAVDDSSLSAEDARGSHRIGVAMRMGGGDLDYRHQDNNEKLPSPSLFFIEEDADKVTDEDNFNTNDTPYEPLSTTVAPRPPSVPPPLSVLLQHEDQSGADPRGVDTPSATASSSSSSAAATTAVLPGATSRSSSSNGKSFERKSVVMASSVIDSNDYHPSKTDADIASAFERAQIAMETACTDAASASAPATSTTADIDNIEVKDEAKVPSWPLTSIPAFGLPKLELPKLDLSGIDLPKPKLEIPGMERLPKLDVPKLVLPVLEMPSLDMRRLELPKMDKLFGTSSEDSTSPTDARTATACSTSTASTIGKGSDVNRLTSDAIGNIDVGPARDLFVDTARKALQFMAPMFEAIEEDQEQVDVPQDTVNSALLTATAGTYLLSSQNPVLTVMSAFLTFYAVNSSGLGGDVARLLGTATTSVGYTCALVVEGTINSCIESLPKSIRDGIETTSKTIGNGLVSTRRSLSESSSVQKTADVIPQIQERVYVTLQGLGDRFVAATEKKNLLVTTEVGEESVTAAAVDEQFELPLSFELSATALADTSAPISDDAATASFTADGSSSFQYQPIKEKTAVPSFEPPNLEASTSVEAVSAVAATVDEVDLLKSFESVASLADNMQDDISDFVKENKKVSFEPPNIDTLLNEASDLSPDAVITAFPKEKDAKRFAAADFPTAFSTDAVEPIVTDAPGQTDTFDIPEMNSISDAFQLAKGLDEPHMDIIRARDERTARIKEGRRRMLELTAAGDDGADAADADGTGEVYQYSASRTTARADLYPKADTRTHPTNSLSSNTITEEDSEADTGNRIDLSAYDTAFDLARAMDEAAIEAELTRLGLTIVGDALEKARRLFLTKSLSRDQLPRSLFV